MPGVCSCDAKASERYQGSLPSTQQTESERLYGRGAQKCKLKCAWGLHTPTRPSSGSLQAVERSSAEPCNRGWTNLYKSCCLGRHTVKASGANLTLCLCAHSFCSRSYHDSNA